MNNKFKVQSLNWNPTCFKHVRLLWLISALDRKQVRGYTIGSRFMNAYKKRASSCTHTHIHTHTYIYIYTYIYIRIYIYIYIYAKGPCTVYVTIVASKFILPYTLDAQLSYSYISSNLHDVWLLQMQHIIGAMSRVSRGLTNSPPISIYIRTLF